MKTSSRIAAAVVGTLLASSAPAALINIPDSVRFDFHDAPLRTILDYMSEAAGFLVLSDTALSGTGDLWSEQPLTREEAIKLLKAALDKNGYTAFVEGRMIMISPNAEARRTGLPIRSGSDPDEIPATSEMVTQVIPLRSLGAAATARDIAALLPGARPITANTDNNSLVVTDTNANLKHLIQLVRALDRAGDAVYAKRIFELKNADPSEVAQLLTDFYSQAGVQDAPQAGGGELEGLLGAALSGGGVGVGSDQTRMAPVLALADPRTYSVVVAAAKGQMPAISAMVSDLDAGSGRNQKVFVYTLKNASVGDAETVLKNLFAHSASSTTTTAASDPLAARAAANANANAQPLQLGDQGVATATVD